MQVGLLFFTFTIIAQPIAQMLEKKGMNAVGAISGIGGNTGLLAKFWTIVTNPYIVGGVALSAFGLFCWLIALSHFKVSYLYPFGAISYIILALLSLVVLGESISLVRWLGIGVIVIGAFLLNQ